MIINLVEALIPYNNFSQSKLTRQFRKEIIEEALVNDLNLIITSGTSGSPTLFEYFTELIDLVEENGSFIYLVHVTADAKTILQRVDDDFRKQHGKNFGRKELKDMIDRYSNVFDKYPHRDHLTIDTRVTSPENAATMIINHYKFTKQVIV